MRNVYTATDQGNKPIVFTLVGENMAKSAANALAKQLRGNGQKVGVFVGNVADSYF